MSNVIDITARLGSPLQREIDRAFPLLDDWLCGLPEDVDPEAMALCMLKAGVQFLTELRSANVAREAAMMLSAGEG